MEALPIELIALIDRAGTKWQDQANPGYLSLSIPTPLDNEIATLLMGFQGSSPNQQTVIRSKFDKTHSFTFLVFSERMAALAVRQRAEDVLFKGLIALAFEDAKFDVRENLLIMAPLYDAAVKIGADPKRLFCVAAEYATNDELKQELAGFPNRPEEARNLAAMGYVETTAPDGFRYKRTW